ncbi:MAG: vWA domain-containing protein, partial [Acidimicrobiales bacterium]
MIGIITGFVRDLRAAGLPVALTEAIDATEAVVALGAGDREALRHALAATLVKNGSHRPTFDTVFAVWFDRAPAVIAGDRGADLTELLEQALAGGDEAALRALAAEAVDRLAGLEAGKPLGGAYYL